MAKAFVFGNNIDTDGIIPSNYINTTDERELGRHCMKGVDATFVQNIKAGDIIVGGANFGCGSSREHAVMAIRGCGVSCVIAVSFARIFYRNAINMGFPILVCPDAAKDIVSGDEVTIDFENGLIQNKTKKETYRASAFPGFVRAMMEKGGLLAYVRSCMNENT